MSHYDNILVIGVNGNVCVNWGQWGGGGFGGTVCPDCGGAQPRFSGKHASRCTCCAGVDCDVADSPFNVCSLDWPDIAEDPEDCRGGYASYSSGGYSLGAEIKGKGTASVNGLLGPFPTNHDGSFRQVRMSGTYTMRWSCGNIGDVIKGYCRNLNNTWEEGVCIGGSDASVTIGTLGFGDSSGGYDCPCNCARPLGSWCQFGEGVVTAACQGGNGTAWCCEDPEYCFEMAWQPSTIKGPLPHSIGRDPAEITYGPCCSAWAGDEGDCCSRYPGGVTFGGADPLSLAENYDCPGQLDISDAFAPCPDDCDECEPAGTLCEPGTIHYGDGCTHCPQLLNISAGTTCWDCQKPRVCNWGYVYVNALDPIITTPFSCYMSASVSVSVGGDNCNEWSGVQPNPCPDCDCGPSCDSDAFINPVTCGYAAAGVSINPI